MTRVGRLVRSLALVFAAALIATACGASAGGEPLAFVESPNPGLSTQLSFGSSDPAPFVAGISEWELDHPTAVVVVDTHESEDLRRSITMEGTLTGGGAAIDVLAIDATLRPLLRTSPTSFVDLRDHVSSEQLDAFDETLLAAATTPDGAIVALPAAQDSLAIALRTDLISDDIRGNIASANDWCTVLALADEFSEDSRIAFLASPHELTRAVLAQSDARFETELGLLGADDRALVEEAWDLAMLALGNDPTHRNPCTDQEPIERVSRNLVIGDLRWRNEAASDGFAAAIVTYGELDQIAAAAPATSGRWEVVPLPGPGAAFNATYLAVLDSTPEPELAVDLAVASASPEVQRLVFERGAPALPTIESLYSDVAATRDPFFGDTPVAPFVLGLERSGDVVPSPERDLVIDVVLEGVIRVANGNQSPEASWETTLEEIRSVVG